MQHPLWLDYIFAAPCAMALLSACGGDELPAVLLESHEPISLASAIEGEVTEVSRVIRHPSPQAEGTQPLARDFVMYGYKGTQVVFDGYKVSYTAGSAGTAPDNTHSYSYVDATLGQSIKYWDYGTTEYNFWGYTGAKSHFSADGTQLTIDGLQQMLTPPSVDDRLFSALVHRSPVTNDVVRFVFRRPYAKVRVMFYSAEPLDPGDAVEIADIAFGPPTPHSIVSGGQLTVSYPTSGAGPEQYTTITTATVTSLSFDPLTLDHHHAVSVDKALTAIPTGGTDYYYVVPNAYTTSFTLSATIDDDAKTAVVPATLMRWLPNHVYTYVFKITESGKKIEFYDVLVEPWTYGGSQEDEWRNW